MKKVTILITIACAGLFTQCSSDPDNLTRARSLLEQGRGIEAHAAVMKAVENPSIRAEAQKLSSRTRSLAELELSSIFIMPRQHKDTGIYLDNADAVVIRRIITADPALKKKYGQYLPTLK